MVNLKCPKCKHINQIVYGISGFNLESAIINFRCSKCDLDGSLTLLFKGDKKPKEEVKFGDTNYIG